MMSESQHEIRVLRFPQRYLPRHDASSFLRGIALCRGFSLPRHTSSNRRPPSGQSDARSGDRHSSMALHHLPAFLALRRALPPFGDRSSLLSDPPMNLLVAERFSGGGVRRFRLCRRASLPTFPRKIPTDQTPRLSQQYPRKSRFIVEKSRDLAALLDLLRDVGFGDIFPDRSQKSNMY